MLIPALVAISVSSCTKEEISGPVAWHPVEHTKTETVDYLPVYGEQDAVLAAITEYSYDDVNGVKTEVTRGSALAVFPSGSGNFLGVGDVRSIGEPLGLESGNRYALRPTPAWPGGLNYPGAPVYRWEVEGTTQFPAVNFICTVGFPVISEMVTSAPEIDRNADFTMGTTLPMDDADSVRFTVFAPNGYLFADKKGSNYTHTFAASKLMLLADGEGFIRITAFNSVPIEVNGKKIQYINQAVTTMPVTIR